MDRIDQVMRENFVQLAALFGGNLECLPASAKSESKSYMDAHFDRLHSDRPGVIVVALAHYYKLNGDSVADPDMEIRLDMAQRTAEALTFQDSMSFNRVYNGETANPKQRDSLNLFLHQWLRNLRSQGHSFRSAS